MKKNIKKKICELCNREIAPLVFKRHYVKCERKSKEPIHYCKCECGKICNNLYVKGHVFKGKKFTEKHKQNIKNNPNFGMKGKHHSEESINKIKDKLTGKVLSEKHKQNISKGSKGKKVSKETKQKLRESRLEQILRDGGELQVGLNEKQLLDEQEIKDNCVIDRNFKVIGYKPDGYCYETNTIYEVYEKFHDKQVQEDLQRENEICNHLSCDFIIIYDRIH